ncbi:MAG: UDP-N-acetylmuramate dehydrogenase [Spirochaetota bacterium]
MLRLKEWTQKINIHGELRQNEPLAPHTTFRVGGPADLYARPLHAADLASLLRAAKEDRIPWFVLGGGSNILVADSGVRGLVIDTTSLAGAAVEGTTLTVGAGLPISDASSVAADHGLGGLDFIYAMPGSVGGAVWMNARCYGGEISEVLSSVEYVDADGRLSVYTPRAEDFGYKRSPFMSHAAVMTSVAFSLRLGDRQELWAAMREHEADRRAKGHFAAPCAGSVFKNDRAFGRPSGAIIDGLGLRGYRVGGAKVSDLHANIVVNAENASATDIRAVIEHVQTEVKRELGFELEREVLFVGDWGDYEQRNG